MEYFGLRAFAIYDTQLRAVGSTAVINAEIQIKW